MEILKNRRIILGTGLAAGTVALAYSCSLREEPIESGSIDPTNLTIEDLRKFYPALEHRPEPNVFIINNGKMLVANYSGVPLDPKALAGTFSYFEGLATTGGSINMIEQTSGKVTPLNIRPREASKRLLFVISQDTPVPLWAPNNLAATTFRFRGHTVGFARVILDKQFPGTHFSENNLNSTNFISVEICQSLVQTSPADKNQVLVATEAQERLCNGFAFGYLIRQTGKPYADYQKFFPRRITIRLGDPSSELIKLEATQYNSIQINGLIVP